MQSLLQDILAENTKDDYLHTKSCEEFDAKSFLEFLKTKDRRSAEKILKERNYRNLGSLFIAAGGTAIDSRKPKDWLTNQILWRLFDFERGHDTIRSRGVKDS
jgi:hypothetical protein